MPESLEQSRKALDIDPLSPFINLHFGEHEFAAGRTDEAIAQARKALELDSGFSAAEDFLATCYAKKELFPQAIEAERKAVETSSRAPVYLKSLGLLEAAHGRPDDARKILAELRDDSKTRYVPPDSLSSLEKSLGEGPGATGVTAADRRRPQLRR